MAEALSRRDLLKLGALGGAGLILAPGWLGCSDGSEAQSPRIVVVGAGLAGLSCAFRLQQRGLGCTVYEANPERIGGRCWTAREFARGQIAEHGGEFIDSRHKRIRALAKRFGFELVDLYAVANPGSPRLWLNGARRHRSELRASRAVFQRRIEAAARRVGAYGYADATPAARAFDELSVADWLDDNCPGGSRGAAGAAGLGRDGERVRPRRRPAERAQPLLRVRGGHPGRRRALPRARRQRPDPTRARRAAARRDCAARRTARGAVRARRRQLRDALRRRRRRGDRRSRRARTSVRHPAPGGPRRRGAEREEAPLRRRVGDGDEREGADAVRPPPAGLRRLERLHDQRRAVPLHLGEHPGRARAAARSSPPTSGAARAPRGCGPPAPTRRRSSGRCGGT